MNKYKSILCLYLTVAVLLSATLTVSGIRLPTDIFTNASPSTQSVFDEPSDECISPEAFTESPLVSEETSLATSYMPEALSEGDEPAKSTVTEEYTQESSESEEPSFSDILEPEYVEPVYVDSYVPDSSAENVSGLNIFSDTVGALSSADSVNVYTFSVEARAMFRYSIIHDELTGVAGWTVSLYQEYLINGTGDERAYRLINVLNTESSSTRDTSPELGLTGGSYRLVVTKGMAFSDSAYKISVELVDGGGYETECNDNIYRYTEIYNSSPLKGSASYFTDRQDEDFYMFRMYSDGFAELKFEHPAVSDKTTVCWQVIFFAEDGTKLYSVNSLFTDTLLKSGPIGLDAGNYFVLVRNRVYTDITYTLTLNRTGGLGYENEMNDSPETANDISFGETVTGVVSSKINGLDRDYFRVTVHENGRLFTEFAHDPSAEDTDKNGWNIRLLSEDGTVLYQMISAWGDDVISASPVGLGQGTYYILIDSESLYLNSQRYYLTVDFDTGDSFESEPNDTFALADTLKKDSPVTGQLAERGTDYDFDCYTFTVEDSCDVTVAFFHELLDYSRNIFTFTLYDENGTAVAYETAEEGRAAVNVPSDIDTVEACYKALPAGKYYIRVATGLFFDKIEYQINYSY